MATRLNQRYLLIIIILLVCIFVLLLLSRSKLPGLTPDNVVIVTSMPDFASYQHITEKKKAFFEFLYPIVTLENNHILEIRQQLLSLREPQNELSNSEHDWLLMLAHAYRVNDTSVTSQLIESLLTRIDIIPVSLILSQAAIESGWGSSRFAKQGNNLFGQWCFKKDCGMVPQNRAADMQHEVAIFDSVNDAVRAYMKNLNSFPAYKSFRQIRLKERAKQSKLQVGKLLAGLEHYSEQGQEYIIKVANLIRQNNLEQYDL